MKTIHMTELEADMLDSGHGPDMDTVRRELVSRAQAMADETCDTVEVYHPDGYVFDARTPTAAKGLA